MAEGEARRVTGVLLQVIDVGGGFCRSVVSVDGHPIAGGQPGPVCAALEQILLRDFENKEFVDEVPYCD